MEIINCNRLYKEYFPNVVAKNRPILSKDCWKTTFNKVAVKEIIPVGNIRRGNSDKMIPKRTIQKCFLEKDIKSPNPPPETR